MYQFGFHGFDGKLPAGAGLYHAGIHAVPHHALEDIAKHVAVVETLVAVDR